MPLAMLIELVPSFSLIIGSVAKLLPIYAARLILKRLTASRKTCRPLWTATPELYIVYIRCCCIGFPGSMCI